MGYTGQNIPANYFKGIEAVGGRIYFDDEGLTFKSHVANIQTEETRILYSEIEKINTRNTLFIVPNGISIITKDGKNHKFVVYKRKQIIEYLKNKML